MGAGLASALPFKCSRPYSGRCPLPWYFHLLFHQTVTFKMAAVDVESRVAYQLSLPSRERVEPGSCNIPLGNFPATNTAAPKNPDQIATAVVEQLNKALEKEDTATVAQLFLENSYWRDHLCLSWDFRTIKGREAVSRFVTGSSSTIRIELDHSSAFRSPHNGPIDGFGEVHGVEFFIKVTTNFGIGQGVVRLAQEGNEWRIFTISTTLLELTGHEEAINFRRPVGVKHGEQQGRQNWQDRRTADSNYINKDPTVLIVGMIDSTHKPMLLLMRL